MKKFLFTGMLVCSLAFLSACTAGGNIAVGPVNGNARLEVHEFRGFKHLTTGTPQDWESSTTVGVVTGTIGGGLGACDGISAGASLSWKKGE